MSYRFILPIVLIVSSQVVAGARDLARQAQAYYRRGDLTNALAYYEQAVKVARDPLRADCLYNLARTSYELSKQPLAENSTNLLQQAIATLQPLRYLPSHRAQATDLLATIYHHMAHLTPLVDLPALESAAELAREAWSLEPNDARRMRNYLRAIEPLPEARRQARIRKAIEQYQQTQPPQLAEQLLQTQRGILAQCPHIHTNAPSQLIVQAESLASQQRQQADPLYALEHQLLTNPQQTNQSFRAEVAHLFAQMHQTLECAASNLEDLDVNSGEPIARLENHLNALWESLALPPALIAEDINLQSNVLATTHALHSNRPDQPTATRLTQHFVSRFPEWGKQVAQMRQSQTNLPPFTLEQQQRIIQLADQTLLLQKTPTTSNQKLALTNLIEIQRLLPKDPNQNQNQNQPPDQKPNPNQDQSKPNNQPEDNNQSDQNQPPPQPKPQQPPEQKPQDDIHQTLRQALEREREHQDKKQRASRPLPSQRRDW